MMDQEKYREAVRNVRHSPASLDGTENAGAKRIKKSYPKCSMTISELPK